MKPPLTQKPRCAAGHPTSDLRSPTSGRGRSRGFTLIELLAVIVLISMLLGLLFGAAQFVVKNARARRAESTAAALQVALCSYRHEYGRWPVPTSLESSITNSTLIISGTNNWMVFDMLRATTNGTAYTVGNPTNIRFIDESTVFALNASGQRMPRYQLPGGDGSMIPERCPIVYQTRDGGTGYFSITFSFEQEKVSVSL